MTDRPIIGISASLIQETTGPFLGINRVGAAHEYSEAVRQSGGVPVILPVCSDRATALAQTQLIDGLLLTGGADVSTLAYGEEPQPLLQATQPERDYFEATLLDGAIARELPVLGICRGLQMLNVFFGGTLYQDLSDRKSELVLQHRQSNHPTLGSHHVEVAANSHLATIVGTTSLLVNSFHHQAIKDKGIGLKLVAHSADGIVEAVEQPNYPFMVGVQWHPEMLAAAHEPAAQHLFSAFVAAAQNHR